MFLSFLLLVAALVLLVVSYFVSAFLLLLWRQARSPLRSLNGPDSRSFFLGNLREMHDQENTNLIARWEAEHGSTFVYRGFIGGYRLMTTDLVAVAHIMGRAYEYPKPDFVTDNLASMAGGHQGLLTVDGEDHKRQRKILNPAFSSGHIKSLTPIFYAKAIELRDKWLEIMTEASYSDDTRSSRDTVSNPLSRSGSTDAPPLMSSSAISFLPNPFSDFKLSKVSPTESSLSHRNLRSVPPSSTDITAETKMPPPTVDVLSWLARATLDIIGEAGFGYAFNSLSSAPTNSGGEFNDENELAHAFEVIFTTSRKFRVMTILQVWFPVLRGFKRNGAALREALATVRRIGSDLIKNCSPNAVTSFDRKKPNEPISHTDLYLEDHLPPAKNLLSILIRSNNASAEAQRLSPPEVLCQISAFLAAGHETTASALTWAFYALARAPAVQSILRTKLRALAVGPALLDDVMYLPYLDAVVREALRLHAPVTNTMRVASRDDVIPVAAPFRNRSGVLCNTICVKKGDIITVPLQAINKSSAVWGEDAAEFRPERWLDADAETEKKRREVPGLWGNMLTFGNGNFVDGNRACIGYRFALAEIKIFLFVLLRDLEVSLDPEIEIEKKINVVTRPCVKSEPHRGNQMPLILRRVPSLSTSPPLPPFAMPFTKQ